MYLAMHSWTTVSHSLLLCKNLHSICCHFCCKNFVSQCCVIKSYRNRRQTFQQSEPGASLLFLDQQGKWTLDREERSLQLVEHSGLKVRQKESLSNKGGKPTSVFCSCRKKHLCHVMKIINKTFILNVLFRNTQKHSQWFISCSYLLTASHHACVAQRAAHTGGVWYSLKSLTNKFLLHKSMKFRVSQHHHWSKFQKRKCSLPYSYFGCLLKLLQFCK